MKVCFGTLATPAILAWTTSTSKDYTGPFNTGSGGVFVLNAATADNTLEFLNPISLGTKVLTVQVNANVATMSGVLTSGTGGGLTKTGNGTLVLSGANTFLGTTTISAGVLRATQGTGLPNTYLKLNGGVYETSGVFTRVNSTTVAGANFNWSGNNGGGFSANGGKLTVTINNDAATEQVFTGTTSANNGIRGTLKFGSSTANAETEFQNKIDLAGGIRTIDVAAGAGGDFATISGVIQDSSSTGSLTKTGAGTLALSGANTYSGNTSVDAGTLEVVNAASLGTNTLAIAAAAKVKLDYSGTRRIGALIINNVLQANGIYGSSTSGAPPANQDDVHFAGPGTVTVGFTPPQPTIASFGISGTDFTITFDTLSGFCYRVEYTDYLPRTTSWDQVSGSQPGTGIPMTVPDPGATGISSQRFYRVVAESCSP